MLTLSLWDETLSVEKAFQQVIQSQISSQKLIQELGRSLIIQKALEEYQIAHPTIEELQRLLDRFKKTRQIKSDSDFQTLLETHRMSLESLKTTLENEFRLQKLKDTLIPKATIRDVFLKRKPTLDQALLSLIRVDNQALAQSLHNTLLNSPDLFSALAIKHSIGPERENGGLLPPRFVMSLNSKLRTTLSQLRPGQISSPFELDENTWIIAKLNLFLPAELTPQLAYQIQEELFQQWLSQQLKLANLHIVEEAVL